MTTNILFVCKHNRFRSKIAEAYFNKTNKNKKFTARSAGLIAGEPVDKNLVSICEKENIKIDRKSRSLNWKIILKTDLLIIVADNIPISFFTGKYSYKIKKVVKWDIPDTHQNNERKIKEISEQIKKKVDKLIRELR